MTYNRKNYVVEVHFASGDVLHKDYGPEQGCAFRAVERLAVHLRQGITKFDALRIWHNGKCIMDRQAHVIMEL